MTREQIEASDWGGNVGLRVPPDVIGLDVDAYKGGLDTLNALINQLGPLPSTRISHSGRNDGSGIRFYRVPILTWVTSLPGIEIIQRVHRYAAVWPSMHPDGRQYGWWDQAEAGPLEGSVPLVEDLPELPWSWIAELSRATQADTSSRSTAADRIGTMAFITTHDTAEAASYASTIIGHFIDRHQQGYSRHDTMQHCLIWAMEMARAMVIAAQPAIDALGELWTAALQGNPRRQALHDDRRVTEFEAMLRHAVGKATAKPQAVIDKLHDDYAGIKMNPQSAPPTESVIVDYQPTDIFIDWEAFIHRDSSVNRWLVEGFWPWGRAMALWAGAKEGKSELALWCACKMALGEHPWTGRPLEPVRVAYFDYEMNEDDLEERLDAFDVDPSRLIDWLFYAQFPPIPPLDSKQGGLELVELVLAVKAQAAVFDTFGRAVEGEEDKADTVRAFYRHTGITLKRHGIGYLRTDHMGKDRIRGQRGSSAKRDDVDVIWSQRRTSSGVLLDCAGSSRLSWVGPTLQLDRVEASDSVSYSAPIQMGWTLPAMTKAAELDAVGLPLEASRSQAIEALKAQGKTPGKVTILVEALRYRRERPQGTGSGTGGNRSFETSENSSGNSETEENKSLSDQLFSEGTGEGTDGNR
jgi:hypothetical protein